MLRLSEPSALAAVSASAAVTTDRVTALEQFLAAAQVEIGSVSILAQELDALVRPALVLNTQTRVAHRALRTERLDPDLCTTFCGWKWARSSRSRAITQAERDAAGPLWSMCPRCAGGQVGQGHV